MGEGEGNTIMRKLPSTYHLQRRTRVLRAGEICVISCAVATTRHKGNGTLVKIKEVAAHSSRLLSLKNHGIHVRKTRAARSHPVGRRKKSPVI